MSKQKSRSVRAPDGTVDERFQARMSVDQETMSSRNIYLYKGKECPRAVLDSRLANILAGYALIKKDLKFVRKAIRLSVALNSKLAERYGDDDVFTFRDEDDEEADLLKALYIAFVVTYGKSFAQARGRGVKLEASEIFKDAPSGELVDIHRELMDHRNEYIAHGGQTTLEQVRTVLLLDPAAHPDSKPTLINDTIYANSLGQRKLEQCAALVEYVDAKLTAILVAKSNALWEREVETVPNHQWYGRVK